MNDPQPPRKGIGDALAGLSAHTAALVRQEIDASKSEPAAFTAATTYAGVSAVQRLRDAPHPVPAGTAAQPADDAKHFVHEAAGQQRPDVRP